MLNENKWAPTIATTDENLSINPIYQQLRLPSLGRQIFTVSDVHGPTGAIFNIVSANGGISFIRNEVEVYDYPANPPKSRITVEALQDIKTQYGENGLGLVAKYLKGLANDDENQKTIAFLNNKSVSTTSLTLTEPTKPDTVWTELSYKIQNCVLEMNSKHIRSYSAYVVLPYKLGASIMSVFAGLDNPELADASSLFVGRSGLTEWYINPDNTDNNVYVGLVDREGLGRGCAVFSPYVNEIRSTKEYDTGDVVCFIWNRYAITESPLHTASEPMMMKFTVN